MKETESIITAYEKAKAAGQGCVLATVVHVEGSSYRRAGARMLVDEYGMMTGAISGGCLEGDALRKALHALEKGENKLITYDTSDEDDAVIGAQLGCNGIIQVLFEPLDFEDPHNPVELLRKAVESGEKAVIVSLFNLQKSKKQPGTKLIFNDEQQITELEEDAELEQQIMDDARSVIGGKYSQFIAYHSKGEQLHAFLHLYTPPPSLVLVGAGNDAQVLSEMAEILGWDISIVDGRPSHASTDRFSNSCQVIVSKPEEVLENISINERTSFVLISHNYNYDLQVLKLLLDIPKIPYIGILGPNKKYQRMLDELKEDGIELSDKQLSRIYAPVGLDIQADTPSEIALSILSEIQSVLTGAHVSHLREREGDIHDHKQSAFKEVEL
ncbi:XdhC family protein [Balneolaceae bacterium YR4-1]|uniref:XdhC family protein n=1 Tax=Halalkalibaculum roseum TaxID=2709311 RepID=A0A6M1SI48_9BACT|nr:XdhC/CoxI family protein [Halalkalibaculum roseum]NGP75031.1 XdhC family protein [Halalkalibaculum roseum]